MELDIVGVLAGVTLFDILAHISPHLLVSFVAAKVSPYKQYRENGRSLYQKFPMARLLRQIYTQTQYIHKFCIAMVVHFVLFVLRKYSNAL